ncbi:MAG: amidohydrolase [Gemmatimonadaceae bacterium]|nr:amidohydrolase [Gemmatimonadaceae bacterium]
MTTTLLPRCTAAALLLLSALTAHAQTPVSLKPSASRSEIERHVTTVMPKVIAWRRDIHEHPELSGEEVRTSKLVAEALTAMGIEVKTGVGGHGVVGLLKGGKPGPVVALRADMDGLPVEELTDLPFKSKARGTYRGAPVGIMHACGHDSHVAMLLGAAQVLVAMKAQLAGTVKFIFQPAEEGLPNGGGGAELMIRDGVLENPKVDAVFGLHVGPGPLGQLTVRPGPVMAASNGFTVTVRGKQTHGAQPWNGMDPIVIGSQIVMGLQTIVSRQVDIGQLPAIITVGAFQGGVRNNIVPDSVVMLGSIRTFDMTVRKEIFRRVAQTAQQIAASAGATARVQIDSGYLVTRNDSALTIRMTPTLQWAANGKLAAAGVWTASEDFSFFQARVPGVYFNLGVTPASQDWRTVPVNHSPLFFVDEAALPTGVKAMAALAVDYLAFASSKK